LISGELIKNAKVTPRGIPALTNPMKSGIDEQEQNGVIIPSKAANKYSKPYHFLPDNTFLTFSTGK
jgi:hypothetical protein